MKLKRYEEALVVLKHAATLKARNPSVHYQMFIALSRLRQKDAAEKELAIFKQLEAERKARSRFEEDDVENPEKTPSEAQPTGEITPFR